MKERRAPWSGGAVGEMYKARGSDKEMVEARPEEESLTMGVVSWLLTAKRIRLVGVVTAEREELGMAGSAMGIMARPWLWCARPGVGLLLFRVVGRKSRGVQGCQRMGIWA